MKHSRKVHGHAQHWPTEKLIRAALMLLIAIAAATGLLLSASSLAKSGRKPVRREPSAPTAKSNDAVSDSSRKDRGVSSNGSQVKVSQRDDITPETLQQIAALEAEKSSRTPAEQKIDSQLLQAIRESRGQQMASGIHLDRANVKADDAGRLEVDIATSVNDDLLSKIEGLGGEILSPSWEYKTVRARVSLSAIEAIAAFSEVRFVQPAVPYDLDRQSKSNLLGLVSTPPDFLAGAGFLSRRSVPVVRPSFAERAERVRRQLRDYLAKNTRSPSRTLLPRVPTGVVNSEGDRTHRADDTRNTYGYQGAGVRIGILSDSFNNRGTASTDIANGELPGPGNPLGNTTPVTVLQDLPSGGSDEGRAMVQIVHDLVPKAQLFFATASAGEATFASNIQALRNAPNNCDVIIDDVSYADEPPFQDGIVAQAVNTVTASGALYFASAGNAGSLAKGTSGVFEGDFNDSGSAAFSGSSKVGTIHNFGTVGSPINGDIITAPGLRYGLFWADPLGGSTNDYDLFVVTSAGAVRASSTNLQSGTQNPVELIALPATFAALDRLVVFKTDAAFARAFHLDTFRGTLTLGTNGQTHAHACAVNAFAVAATPAVGRRKPDHSRQFPFWHQWRNASSQTRRHRG